MASESMTKMFTIVNQLRRSALLLPLAPQMQGMNLTQFQVLAYILHHQEKDVFQRDIENALKLRRSSVSSLLGSLERKGYLKRVPVPTDARLKKLVLSPESFQLMEAVEQFQQQSEALFLQALTEEEVDTLCAILEKIQKNLDNYPL